MDKISGIIPSSPRVSSVDLKEASPVRPGTPAFGRATGVSTVTKDFEKDGGFQDTARKGATLQQQQLDWRSKDAKQAAIASELSEKFFIKNRQAAAGPEDNDTISGGMRSGSTFPSATSVKMSSTPVSSVPTGFKGDRVFQASIRPPAVESDLDDEPLMSEGPSSFEPASSKSGMTAKSFESSAPPLQQPEGLFPRGSFIDRSA